MSMIYGALIAKLEQTNHAPDGRKQKVYFTPFGKLPTDTICLPVMSHLFFVETLLKDLQKILCAAEPWNAMRKCRPKSFAFQIYYFLVM